MPNETLPNYAPGYTVSKDRFGNLVDISDSLTERFCLLGLAWRIDSGYVSLAADGAYTLINFTTPATGRVYYNFADVEKSGAEVLRSLIRGGTVAGSPVAATCYNFDDAITEAAPVTGVSVGGTITGGVERFASMAPGASNPSSMPGGNSRASGLVLLRKNTQYSLKLTAKGGAATVMAFVGFAYIPTAD